MPSLFFSIIFVSYNCHKFTSFALTSSDLRVISLALAMPSGSVFIIKVVDCPKMFTTLDDKKTDSMKEHRIRIIK